MLRLRHTVKQIVPQLLSGQRLLGQVILPDGTNVNHMLVRNGRGLRYAHSAPARALDTYRVNPEGMAYESILVHVSDLRVDCRSNGSGVSA
jgi:endonuclease YncB( thermonuclease family)